MPRVDRNSSEPDPRRIVEPEVWRAAADLVGRHGAGADLKAAAQVAASEEEGNEGEARHWRKILLAVILFQTEGSSGAPVN